MSRSICSRCRFIGTSVFATRSSPYKTRRPCFMSKISMAKTSAACRNSSCVKKSGAGSFCSTHHHFTTPASLPSSSTLSERKIHTTFRSECPSRKSPRAAEPNKMTHSKFVAANSLNRFTSSVSLPSVESISASISNSPKLCPASDSLIRGRRNFFLPAPRSSPASAAPAPKSSKSPASATPSAGPAAKSPSAPIPARAAAEICHHSEQEPQQAASTAPARTHPRGTPEKRKQNKQTYDDPKDPAAASISGVPDPCKRRRPAQCDIRIVCDVLC